MLGVTVTLKKHIFSDGFISIFIGSAHILDVVCPHSSDGENIGRVTRGEGEGGMELHLRHT